MLMALISLLILCTAFSISSIQKDKIKQLVVYNVSGKKAIAFILQRHVYYDFDSALINNDILMRYTVRDHWYQCGVQDEKNVDSIEFGYPLTFGRMYVVNNKRILQVDKTIPDSMPRLKADIVILSSNDRNTVQDVRQKVDFKELVFDTSNTPSHTDHWIDDCEKMQVRYYDCRIKAFQMDL
jgi:hypothetical protein